MKQYKVMFTWNGKLGNQYTYVTATSQADAKNRVKAMYGDKVTVHWAEEAK